MKTLELREYLEKLDRLAKAMDIKINIEECHITLDGDTLYIKGHK